MKAWVLHDINNMTYEEYETPKAADGWALVDVKATGICGSDIPRAFVTGAHVKPLIIGHEFSGQVSPEDNSVWAGKRVGIFPLIPCGKCAPCQNKQYEMCRNYNYLGSRCDGAFADKVCVPLENLIELPDNVTYEQAAMLEPMAVAVHAMRRGLNLTKGKKAEDMTVAVCGLGTIGMFLVMFLKQAGFNNIIAIGNKDFQKDCIEKLGISKDNYCDCKTKASISFINEKTDGLGVDLYFECVGKNETISDAVESTMPAGSIVLVGNPYSDMSFDKNVYWKILRNQIKLTGTWNSSFTHEEDDDWHYVLDCLKKEEIHPEAFITHKYPMDKIMEGFEIMRDKKEDYIKIMGLNE